MPVPAPGAERHLNGSKGVTTMKKRIVALILALVLLVPCALASAEVYYRLKDRAKLRQLPNYSCVVLDSYRADWALTINNVVDKNWASITFTNDGKYTYLEEGQHKSPDFEENFGSRETGTYKFEAGNKLTLTATGYAYKSHENNQWIEEENRQGEPWTQVVAIENNVLYISLWEGGEQRALKKQ